MNKKYFLTKYALSKGIEELSCVSTHPGANGRIDVHLYGYSWFWFTVGKDAHETEAAAKAAAESMRLKKIASLKKQIAKLEAMKF